MWLWWFHTGRCRLAQWAESQTADSHCPASFLFMLDLFIAVLGIKSPVTKAKATNNRLDVNHLWEFDKEIFRFVIFDR